MSKIDTARWWPFFEAVIGIICQLVAIYIGYKLFALTVSWMGYSQEKGEAFINLLLLPALYVLRDIGNIFDSMTVSVSLNNESVSVTRGLNPRVVDSLEFKSIENTEVVTTFGGRCFGFSTIRLYSPGGLVEIPYVENPNDINQQIKRLIKASNSSPPPTRQLLITTPVRPQHP